MITVYINKKRMASYKATGDITKLLEKLSAFYGSCYPSADMLYELTACKR